MSREEARTILIASGSSILCIGFDPAAFAKLLPDQQQEFVRWRVACVLKGEASAVAEWERMGPEGRS